MWARLELGQFFVAQDKAQLQGHRMSRHTTSLGCRIVGSAFFDRGPEGRVETVERHAMTRYQHFHSALRSALRSLLRHGFLPEFFALPQDAAIEHAIEQARGAQ